MTFDVEELNLEHLNVKFVSLMERGRKPTASCLYLRIHRLPEPAWCGPEQAFAVPVYTSIVIHVDFDENARVFDASCEELDKRCK